MSEGFQELQSMRNGSVVAQNATIDFDAALATPDEEIARVKTPLERLTREERQIIEEREAQRQAALRAAEAAQPPAEQP